MLPASCLYSRTLHMLQCTVATKWKKMKEFLHPGDMFYYFLKRSDKENDSSQLQRAW